jgi:TonB family protein
MTNSLLGAGVVLCACAGLWGQAASPAFIANPSDSTEAAASHAKDPVGFQLLDKRDPNNRGPYPDEVVSAIRERWYLLVSALRQVPYDQQGVAIVAFRIKKDGSLAKAAIAETSKEERIDGTALNAVRSAAPFKPLPKEFESKSIGFRIHLGYNQPIPGDPCPTTFPGVYQVHYATTNPRAVYTPGPEYSEDARKANYQGTTTLGLTAGGDGLPYDVCVVNALGHGLDEKAIEAVKQWKFEPAVKDGRTVPVRVSVETDFRLY